MQRLSDGQRLVQIWQSTQRLIQILPATTPHHTTPHHTTSAQGGMQHQSQAKALCAVRCVPTVRAPLPSLLAPPQPLRHRRPPPPPAPERCAARFGRGLCCAALERCTGCVQQRRRWSGAAARRAGVWRRARPTITHCTTHNNNKSTQQKQAPTNHTAPHHPTPQPNPTQPKCSARVH
jgi:hypothetical protein